MDRIIQNVEARLLVIILAALTILTLLAFYLYVFKEPIKLLQQSQQTLVLLKAENDRGIPLGQQLEELQKEADSIKLLVNASGQQLPQNQMIAYVIGQLDLIAAHHDVKLVSVNPGSASQLFMFDELPFNIEIHGRYGDLYNWLKDVEKQLGPMVIKSFKLEANGNTGVRRMNSVIVSYMSRGEL